MKKKTNQKNKSKTNENKALWRNLFLFISFLFLFFVGRELKIQKGTFLIRTTSKFWQHATNQIVKATMSWVESVDFHRLSRCSSCHILSPSSTPIVLLPADSNWNRWWCNSQDSVYSHSHWDLIRKSLVSLTSDLGCWEKVSFSSCVQMGRST